ncbi:DUF5706 domain-containing protein [Kineococcus sp. NBC_00420]|uniref:Pycsar system effector family protein n=1 Tax=Kineococcus sp. NBC_00420 TaxID=2903564 RepID=UPI002E1D3E60
MLWNLLRRRPPAPLPTPTPTPVTPADPSLGVVFGWQVHTAQEAWTGKVDAKASILLALEGGLLAAVLAGSAQDGLLISLHGWRQISTWIGTACLTVAIVLAALAVMPSLGRARTHKQEAADNFIYFGHLRHLDPAVLAACLGNLNADKQLSMLTRQLTTMSRANWRKHCYVRWSVIGILIAITTISTAITWPR